ncbi:hypothetical protein [Gemmatimonas sp.]|uniref:hypothetical protein n=1 Tax=Gemmatimonas sp. TaxID=1962908 RepID=UPI0035643156
MLLFLDFLSRFAPHILEGVNALAQCTVHRAGIPRHGRALVDARGKPKDLNRRFHHHDPFTRLDSVIAAAAVHP